MGLESTDISARTIGDETIVLSLKASRYFTITGVGVRMFELLAEDTSLDELVRTIVDEYEVDPVALVATSKPSSIGSVTRSSSNDGAALVHLREVNCVRPGPSGLPVISAWDVAIGHPAGSMPPPPQPTSVDPDPARALRDALRPALLRTPCVVAFSGGRDSSLLLAVAADLAGAGHRASSRRGSAVAVDPSRHHHRAGQHRAADGTRSAAHGGPTFPTGLGNTILLAQHAAGGSLGGHRAIVLRTVARRRGRGLRAADWRHAVACAAPGSVRLRMGRRETGSDPRSYRVDFSAVHSALPGFAPQWTIEEGAQELHHAYTSYRLSQEAFDRRFTRLARLSDRQGAGELTDDLRPMTAAVPT